MQTKACFLLLMSAMVVIGCGKKPGLVTYPVTGTVTYQGKPIAGATVSYFVSVDSPPATGMTDSDGKFSLATHVSPKEVLPGAPPGDYKVTISKSTPTVDAASVNMENLSDEQRQRRMIEMMSDPRIGKGQQSQGPAKPKSEIPEKYAKAETSGLTATVLSGENPPKEFKLTDD